MAFETTKQVKFVASVDGADRVKAGFKGIGDSMGGLERAAIGVRGALGGLVGLATVGGIFQLVNGAIEAKAKLYDLGLQTGISVEQLGGLSKVALLSGTSMEEVSAASNKLSKALATNNEDSKGAAQGIKALGLDFNTFKALGADEQLLAVAKAMEGFADGTGKTAAAMLLFGKSGAALLPFLKELAERGVMASTQTTEMSKAAKEYSDNLTLLRGAGEGFTSQLSSALLPALVAITQELVNVKGETKEVGVVIGGIKVLFETITVLAANVAFVFAGVGREIGAIVAQGAALARGDFSGFSAISQAVIEDGKKARAELEAFERKVLGVKDAVAAVDGSDARFGRSRKPQVDVKPTEKPVIDKARLDAEKLQRKQVLDFIDQQREAEDELTRSIVEQDEKKRQLLEKDVEASRRALTQAQLEFDSYGLLQSQVAELTLARLRDKLAATEAGSAAEDAVRREIALQEQLIDVLQRGERRDQQFRNDPLAGANRAVKAYLEEIQAAGLATERAVGGAIRSLEDGLVQFVTKGKLDVRSLIDAMIAEFLRLQVIRPLLQSLFSSGGFLSGLFGGSSGPEVLGEAGGYGARAAGGPVAAGGMYLVGEKGPEILRMGSRGGSITPNSQIGRSVAVEYKPTIVIDSRTDRNEVRQLVAASVQQGNRQLVELMKSRGVFA